MAASATITCNNVHTLLSLLGISNRYHIHVPRGVCLILNKHTSRSTQKYNLTKGLLEKSKLDQHAQERSHKICWKEVEVFQIEPNTTYRKYRESITCLCYIIQPVNTAWTSLPFGLPLLQQRSKTTTPPSEDYLRKSYFYVGTTQGICPFSDDFYSYSTLILTTTAMRQYMDKGARPQVCGVLLMFMFALTHAGGLCCASFT
jgi:hypothetical protein